MDEPLQLETFDAAGTFDARYSYHADHLGSIRFLTDAVGDVVNAYDYDSYGQPTAEVEAVEQPFRYTGREWDAAAELYHYRARGYDPSTGRFMQEDPAGVVLKRLQDVLNELGQDFANGDVGTSQIYSRLGSFPTHNINPYRYVENNPVKYVDPFGNLPFNSFDGYKRGMAVTNSLSYGMKKLSGKSMKFAARAMARSAQFSTYQSANAASCAMGVTAALSIKTGPATGLSPGSAAQNCFTVTRIALGVGAILSFGVKDGKDSLDEAIDRFKEEWNKYNHNKGWNLP